MNNKISVAIKYLLGVIFLFSAYTKAVGPGLIEIILIDHGIAVSREVAAALTRILIGFEFGLGILFFLPYESKRITLPLAALFLTAFTFYLLYTEFVLGDSQNCGCFGSAIAMSPIESALKNIALIILLFTAYKLEKKSPKNLIIPLSVLVVSLVIVFIAVPFKSADEFPFSDYTHFEGAGRVDLSSGEKFVAVFNTECEHCQELASEIAESDKDRKLASKLFTLFYSEGEVSVDSFKTLTGYDYPYRLIGVNEFFDLIGSSPPRIYVVRNGVVKDILDDNFDEFIETLKK
ncbi:MauE/DoxX family redox-associated membrane protein [Melioribacter sp. Ez-97]|uniref:MauE/DoxX family redox-associated membrane protein n=1 Tax=Melioribacter sp. Ez-97 TaxID=3423434 RepID=UPI003EDA1323